MDADNDDRPHWHIEHLVHPGCDDHPRVVDYDESCNIEDCNRDHVVVVPLDEYRALVAAARDRHPANQQRGPDPATRADNCICWGYGDDHHAACPACTP